MSMYFSWVIIIKRTYRSRRLNCICSIEDLSYFFHECNYNSTVRKSLDNIFTIFNSLMLYFKQTQIEYFLRFIVVRFYIDESWLAYVNYNLLLKRGL